MSDKVFSIRIPEQLYNEISERAKAEETSMTKVAIEALSQVMGIANSSSLSPSLDARVSVLVDEILTERLEGLNDRLKKLNAAQLQTPSQ